MAEVIALLRGGVLLLFIAAGVFLRRRGFSRVPPPDSPQVTGMVIMEAFQGEYKGHALREMEYRKKSWREHEDDGDDIERHESRQRSPGVAALTPPEAHLRRLGHPALVLVGLLASAGAGAGGSPVTRP